MRVTLAESVPFAATTTQTAGTGHLRVQIINEGIGSSGAYPAATLQAAADATVFAAGTHVYLDHPTESEAFERPERSVRDLAGKLATDAVYENGALVAEVEVFSTWRQAITEMADTIGLSIRATAVIEEGEFDGRRLPVVQEIVSAQSVDFVTKAGRGGRVLEVIESARATGRAVARGVDEATANDRREQLTALVSAAHGDGDAWVWVRDFDDTAVWFELDDITYQQAYVLSDDVATALSGERTQVRAHTTYVPVDPAGQPTTQESEEDTMPQIEEARLRQLEEAHGRVPTLESERDTAVRRAETAETELAEARRIINTATAERIVREAFDAAGVSAPKTIARLAEGAALTDTGQVDEAALKATADESAAELAEAGGAGRVRGLGGTDPQPGDRLTESDIEAAVAGAFGHQVKEA